MASTTYTCPKCGEELVAEHEKKAIADKLLHRQKRHHRKACDARQRELKRQAALAAAE
jgi:ribosomal protein S27AE